MSHNAFFLEESRLGVLQHACGAALYQLPAKRKRQVAFRRLSAALKQLGLLPPASSVLGISLGVNYLGERGLFILTAPSARLIAEAPQGDPQ